MAILRSQPDIPAPVDQRGFKVRLHPTKQTHCTVVDVKEATTEVDISRCHMVKVDIVSYLPDVVVYLMADNKDDAVLDAGEIWKKKLNYIREKAGVDSEDVIDLIVSKSVQKENNYG